MSSRLKRPVTEGQLSRDAAALERFYQDQGFMAAQVERSTAKTGRRAAVVFHVSEGARTTVRSIDIAGCGAMPAATLSALLAFRTGSPLRAADVQAGVAAIRTHYLNTGYPFIEVSVTAEQTDSLSAAVSYTVSEGPRCRIADVRVRGNATVRTGTVVQASEVRVGALYSQKLLYAAQRRLYSTRLFSRVSFYVLRPDTTRAEVVVRFDVTEQPCRGFALGAGVETPPNRFLLSLEWEHDNLLNLGHTMTAGVELSPALNGDLRAGTDASYRVPYFVLTRVDFSTRPYFAVERIDSTDRVDFGIETGLSRSVSPQLTVGLSNRLRFVAPSLTGTTNSLALTSQLDTRNDYFDPSRGCYVQAAAEQAGGLLGGNNDFHRVSGEVRAYQALWFGAVAAGRAMVGHIFPFGRIERAPYYESFTLGGRSSLRGHDEKSLGPDSAPGLWRYGPAVLNGNLELRSPYIVRLVGVVLFADAGQVVDRYDLTALEFSAGAGLRVRTPVGPVRLDWGRRLRGPAAADRGRFYLGLLHAF